MRHTAIGESHEESSEMGAWRRTVNGRRRLKVQKKKKKKKRKRRRRRKQELCAR